MVHRSFISIFFHFQSMSLKSWHTDYERNVLDAFFHSCYSLRSISGKNQFCHLGWGQILEIQLLISICSRITVISNEERESSSVVKLMKGETSVEGPIFVLRFIDVADSETVYRHRCCSMRSESRAAEMNRRENLAGFALKKSGEQEERGRERE